MVDVNFPEGRRFTFLKSPFDKDDNTETHNKDEVVTTLQWIVDDNNVTV